MMRFVCEGCAAPLVPEIEDGDYHQYIWGRPHDHAEARGAGAGARSADARDDSREIIGWDEPRSPASVPRTLVLLPEDDDA